MRRGGTEPPRANTDGATADTDSEWGLSKNKAGMSRETKIGLCLILVLACAFGFVVYKRVQRRNGYLAEESDAGKHQHAQQDSHPLKPTTGHKRFKKDPVFEPTKEPFLQAQREPKKLDEFDPQNNHNLQQPKGRKSNPFGSQSKTSQHDHNHQHAGQQTSNPFAGDSHSSHQHSGAGKVSLGPENKSTGGNPFGSFGDGKSSGPFARKTQSSASNEQKSNDVWELGGNTDGKSTTSNSTPQNGNPFAGGQTQSGGSPFPRTNQQSHGKTGGGPSFFPPANKQAGYQLPKDDKPFDPRHPGGRTGQANSKPLPLFGGQSTSKQTADTHGHHQHGTGGTHENSDRRFGKYQVGSPKSAHANSSTTVQTGGEDLDYPFGRPGKGESNHSTGSSTGRHSHQGSPFGGRPFSKGSDAGQADSFPLNHGQGIDPGDQPKAYRVQYGDNYWTISRKAYGTARYYTALDAYNRYRIPNPNRMRPGMIVLIPSVDILAKRFPKLCPGGGVRHASHSSLPTGFFRDRNGNAMYRVGKTDTLSDIAQKHLGRASRWIQVYRMNQDRITDPNRLKIGTTLRLPGDASNIQVVRGPGRYR